MFQKVWDLSKHLCFEFNSPLEAHLRRGSTPARCIARSATSTTSMLPSSQYLSSCTRREAEQGHLAPPPPCCPPASTYHHAHAGRRNRVIFAHPSLFSPSGPTALSDNVRSRPLNGFTGEGRRRKFWRRACSHRRWRFETPGRKLSAFGIRLLPASVPSLALAR
jgi:hypothetical protein